MGSSKLRRVLASRHASLVVFLAAASAPPARASEHDAFARMTDMFSAPQDYSGSRRDGRRLEAESCEATYENAVEGPLRIGFEVVQTEGVPQALVQLAHDIMEHATKYWSSVLRVRQATSPLIVYPGVDPVSYGSAAWFTNTATKCGPEVEIPPAYMVPVKVCKEWCPVKQKACEPPCSQGDKCMCNYTDWAREKGDYCCKVHEKHTCLSGCTTDDWDSGIDVMQYNSVGYPFCKGSCTEVGRGPGAVDKDMFVFVKVSDSEQCKAYEGMAAYASACGQDQCDRPVFGYIVFCQAMFSLEPSRLSMQLTHAVHELAHVLGFSSMLFRYFRDPQGSPLVPRDPNNTRLFEEEVPYECDASTNEVSQWGSGKELTHVDLAPRVADHFDERGFSQCGCPIGTSAFDANACLVRPGPFKRPHCVVKIVLPTVVEKVREHFGCPELNGAELENQDTSTCQVFGSHWEGRLFAGELMSAVSESDGAIFVSNVTLALLQDSGWYKVDWAMADELVPGVHWGVRQGCDFATKRCVEAGETAHPRHFCTRHGENACSLERRRVRQCSVATAAPGSLPAVFDYFGGSGQHGPEFRLDYCPAYTLTVSGRACGDAASVRQAMRLELLGEGSRCLTSTLRNGSAAGAPAPGCYRAECAAHAASYTVWAEGMGGVVSLGSCTAAGARLAAPGLAGYVECAAPAELCGVRPSRHQQIAGLDPLNPPPPSASACAGRLRSIAALVFAVALLRVAPRPW